ncbi:MAG: YfhO family protein [Bacteroidota bacterium]|nr:YfhO family protein [Bacteroidota bacterium]
MNKTVLTKFAPHVAAFLLFVCISFMYFSPVLEGKQLIGHDTESWLCMAKETIDYNATHNDVTLWTNSMFGGMPTYQISMSQPYNLIKYVEDVIRFFPNTVFNLMLYLMGFYVLLLAFRINPWLAIVGAIAFSFASYNFIIILAGHNSKAITIAYMAPLIGSVFLAFRDKRLLGSLLTAFFLSLAIRANHVQILYYTVFILIFLAVVELIFSIKEKEISSFLKTSSLLLVAAAIAVGMNATSLLTTYDYSKATMRGESNGLTVDTQNSQHGLNKDYITQWSYGIDETMTLLIPDFKGGGSGGTLTADSETGRKLTSLGAPDVNKIMKENQFPLYWGSQPFTSGPVYIGAIICFLFVLGIFLVDKRTKWWLLPMIILTLMLAWGKNFMWLTNIFIDYVPMYNKFRTVSMMLVATGFGMTLMAILALKEVFNEKTDKQKLMRPLMISAAIVGGIALLFALIPSLSGDFISPADAQYTGNNAFLKETLPLDRASLLRGDALRSLLFVILSAGLIWLYIKDFLKLKVAYVLLGALMLFDLVPVAKRYLNNDSFQRPRHIETLITPSKADNIILQDKSQFRVLDGTVNIFNDASPSYFHKNIGGYHAAKLRRYQELINMHIDKEIGRLFATFGRATSPEIINNTMDSLGVLNMLNMKYLIYNKEAAPIVNPHANGNVWLIHNIRVAENANDEMKLLGEINTKKEMVVDKLFASQLPAKLESDTTAHISLIKYEPNDLVYHFSSKTNQVAVFSEIYYDKGWNAYINGNKVPYVRANYLLRAMPLKAGNYDIEYKFEPASYSIGNTIALISSLLLILSLFGYAFWRWNKSRKRLQ